MRSQATCPPSFSKSRRSYPGHRKRKNRAAEFLQFGIKPLDALHLALAEAGRADYLCTCDDRLLRSAKTIKDLSVKVINPVDLVQEIEK
ncbi:MAG: hypothetical protein DDG59_11865 [Anaerolineae bacterium]|nr:MAG: hypothetical protein DDG59_11865 [Anaerolineae bacterium]